MFSLSESPPLPRLLPRAFPTASISSIYKMQGAFSRACANRSRTRDGPTPVGLRKKERKRRSSDQRTSPQNQSPKQQRKALQPRLQQPWQAAFYLRSRHRPQHNQHQQADSNTIRTQTATPSARRQQHHHHTDSNTITTQTATKTQTATPSAHRQQHHQHTDSHTINTVMLPVPGGPTRRAPCEMMITTTNTSHTLGILPPSSAIFSGL